jgi:hypothetical protein
MSEIINYVNSYDGNYPLIYNPLDFKRQDNTLNQSTTIVENKNIKNVPTPVFKPFNDDVLAYWDFSDINDLGYDFTGNGNSGSNIGCLPFSDTTFANAIHIINPNGSYNSRSNIGGYTPAPTSRGVSPNFYSGARVINLNKHASSFKKSAITITGWINYESDNLDMALSTIFTLQNKDGREQITIFIQRNAGIYAKIVKNGIAYVQTGIIPGSSLTNNTWVHFCFSMSSAGITLFVDNIQTVNYNVGNSSMFIDLSTIDLVECTIGGIPNTLSSTKIPEYSQQYWGKIANVMVFDRVITSAERLALFNKDMGYSCIILGGQSNMVGSDTPVVGIDDDYTELYNKVYAYNTKANLQSIANNDPPVIIASSINLAQRPIGFPTSTPIECCLWRTFCIDYIKYLKLPALRKICLIPTASGGTGFMGNALTNALWIPTGRLYLATIACSNDVISKTSFSKIGALLWNQGESSITLKNVDHFDNVNNMIAGYTAQISTFDSNTPIVMAKISSPYYNNFTSNVGDLDMKKFVNDSFIKLCNPITYPNRKLVETEDISMKFTNTPHYSAVSLRELGVRYFDAFALASNAVSSKAVNKELLIFNQDNKTTKLTSDLFMKPNLSGYTDIPINTCFNITKIYASTLAYTGNISINYKKIGPILLCTFLNVPSFITASNNIIRIPSTIVPVNLRPLIDQVIIGSAVENNVSIAVTVQMLSTGEINIYKSIGVIDNASSKFSNGVSLVLNGVSAVCYTA